MGRLFALIAVIAIIGSADCSGPICDPAGSDTSGSGTPANLPAAGVWSIELDQPELSGPCEGIDTQPLTRARLQADLGTVGDRMVHIDLEGVHLEGTVWSDHVYAEGWSDDGFMSSTAQADELDTGNPSVDPSLRLPLGATWDATLDDPAHMNGELLLLMETQRGTCQAVAAFRAELLPWSEGDPSLCDKVVPADPEAPVTYPDADRAVDGAHEEHSCE